VKPIHTSPNRKKKTRNEPGKKKTYTKCKTSSISITTKLNPTIYWKRSIPQKLEEKRSRRTIPQKLEEERSRQANNTIHPYFKYTKL